VYRNKERKRVEKKMGVWGEYDDENDRVQDLWNDFMIFIRGKATSVSMLPILLKAFLDGAGKLSQSDKITPSDKIGLTLSLLRQMAESNLTSPTTFGNMEAILARRIQMINESTTRKTNISQFPVKVFSSALRDMIVKACEYELKHIDKSVWKSPALRRAALRKELALFQMKQRSRKNSRRRGSRK